MEFNPTIQLLIAVRLSDMLSVWLILLIFDYYCIYNLNCFSFCLLIAEQSATDCHESEPLPSPGRAVLLLICNSPITVRQTRLIIIVNIVQYPTGAAVNVVQNHVNIRAWNITKADQNTPI